MKNRILSFLNPIRIIIASFLMLILTGSLLLLLPVSTHHGISYIDSLFTSTSAVCVTGLIVLDTPNDFTLFGRIVILILIQIGGLGIMTFSMGFLAMLGGSLSVKWRFTFMEIYESINRFSIGTILKYVVRYTLVIEFFTAAILMIQFSRDFPIGKAIEHSIFHAVSAFCNAGFSTFSDSLIQYRGNILVNMTIATAVILGGIGFIVLFEITKMTSQKKSSQRPRLSLHSKIVLVVTLFLTVTGMITFLLLEWDHSLSNLPVSERVLSSFFQSVTCRTAGFNTVETGDLRPSTLFMMLSLMFIGGSPGSIAGGVKTTTFGVLILMVISKFKGLSLFNIFKRTLSKEIIERSTTLLTLSIIFILTATFTLLVIQDFDTGHTFLSVLFETVSAFGTVGLSTGITNELPNLDKCIISLIMLIGRLGPLSIIIALTKQKKKIEIEYAEEQIMIG